ncbi:hypothetical protein [Streptomyces sp. MB09-02B]|uniref:hypothetical protein n=1 Tax=Streptomyces sp. MB09-02B TaxID=3028667 RepID=UPI0029B57A14|nr:hypothetical protein [Streptomyces sp. MB09-02B]MDX3643033.1 hypothetical protein [Streptomyces sp. MB09-02B]
MKKNSVTPGLSLVIGAVIAAGSIVQDNYVGAVFAVVFCTIVSLVLHVRSKHPQGR